MVLEEVQRRHGEREMLQGVLDRKSYCENSNDRTGNLCCTHVDTCDGVYISRAYSPLDA